MSKIEATIGNIGDMIGWKDDNNTVGPIAAVAKQSLLRLILHIMPVFVAWGSRAKARALFNQCSIEASESSCDLFLSFLNTDEVLK